MLLEYLSLEDVVLCVILFYELYHIFTPLSFLFFFVFFDTTPQSFYCEDVELTHSFRAVHLPFRGCMYLYQFTRCSSQRLFVIILVVHWLYVQNFCMYMLSDDQMQFQRLYITLYQYEPVINSLRDVVMDISSWKAVFIASCLLLPFVGAFVWLLDRVFVPFLMEICVLMSTSL